MVKEIDSPEHKKVHCQYCGKQMILIYGDDIVDAEGLPSTPFYVHPISKCLELSPYELIEVDRQAAEHLKTKYPYTQNEPTGYHKFVAKLRTLKFKRN